MEKYGVKCGCAQGKPPEADSLVKTASGEEKCAHCGKVIKPAPEPEPEPQE